MFLLVCFYLQKMLCYCEQSLVVFTGLGQRCSVYQRQESGTLLVDRSSANSLCPRPLASQWGQPGTVSPTCAYCLTLAHFITAHLISTLLLPYRTSGSMAAFTALQSRPKLVDGTFRSVGKMVAGVLQTSLKYKQFLAILFIGN